ncbi:hypothetical protein MTF65_05585, partial [Streptomyces sp. APSN-46.1]|uniref:DUF6777 domain-containing protein n=1 Tax=Streptomyces sp. APSN-46.1 TaxID=2929049 RepID=UPI001FB467D1
MPKLATGLVALVAAVALALVLTRPSGTDDAGSGEVFLEPVNAVGPAPFTDSTAVGAEVPPPEGTPPPQPPPSPPQAKTTPGSRTPETPYETGRGTDQPPTGTTTVARSISGAAPGVYGGTKNAPSCDVEKQIKGLTAVPSKNSAFAASVGVAPSAVPGYLRSLTPVQVRLDTRVTNHGYREGKSDAYQAVLQTGTSVMVDDRGVPRVRCACGNPLGGPVALKANPKRHGQPWKSYQPAKVVVIAPSVKVVKKFVIYDHHEKHWYEREHGHHDKGRYDKPVPPPPPPWTPGEPPRTWNPADPPVEKQPRDVPKEDLPKEDVPKEDLPKEDVPKEDLPKEDVPKEDVPKEDLPKEDVPKEDVPKEDVPKEDLPKEDVPKEDLPKEDLPKEDVPKEDLPKEDLP